MAHDLLIVERTGAIASAPSPLEPFDPLAPQPQATAGIAAAVRDLVGARPATVPAWFAGALRRSELTALADSHIEILETFRAARPAPQAATQQGRPGGTGATVVIPASTPHRALSTGGLPGLDSSRRITPGPIVRRTHRQPRPKRPPDGWTPTVTLGAHALDDGTIARIVKARARRAGRDVGEIFGHSLRLGVLNTAADDGAEPKAMKQLGRHESYATVAQYLEGRKGVRGWRTQRSLLALPAQSRSRAYDPKTATCPHWLRVIETLPVIPPTTPAQ